MLFSIYPYMESLINKLPDINARNKFLDFSHLSDDRQHVYINFVNQDPVPVAKKLHDGTKIVPQGVYEDLFEAIIEQEDDHSVDILNEVLLKEVSKFNEYLIESSQGLFNDEIDKLNELYSKYLDLNIFNVSISKWNSSLFPRIDDLLMNKILRSHNVSYAKVLDIRNKFVELQDAKLRAVDYQKLIEQIVDNVKFDNYKLKLSQKLFEDKLTFKLALDLPTAEPKRVVDMLLKRLDYDDEKSQYVLRDFESIQEMIDVVMSSSIVLNN